MLSHVQSPALSRGSPTPSPSKSMSGWIEAMADAVDAHEAAQAPPTSKAASPPSMPAVSIDETPTEPATSPRLRPCPFYLEELPTSYEGDRSTR